MRRALALVGLALAVASCGPVQSTEIIVVVSSDYAPASELARVRVTTEDEAGAPISVADFEVGTGTGRVSVPFSFGVRPAGPAERPLRLVVEGLAPGATEPRVVRRVTVPFVVNERRRLRIVLARACEPVTCPDSEETCLDGACVDRTLPVSALDPVIPGQELEDLDAGMPPTTDAGPSCRDDSACDAIDVEVGDGFACALRRSGRVACWGEAAAQGQLGNGETAPSTTPVAVRDVADAEALVLGTDFACVRSETLISCWGANDLGQLARAVSSSATAAPIEGMAPVASLLAAGRTSCAGSGGELACWGAALPIPGEPLPDLCGGVACARTPVVQPALASVIALADEGHLCLAREGRAACVGDNRFGEVGDGTRQPRTEPAGVIGLDFVWSIATTERSACAIDAIADAEGETVTSRVRCWGADDVGQLGDAGNATERCADDVACSPTPVIVSGLAQPIELAATGETVCAREEAGRVLCWGSDAGGALGDGPSAPTRCAETPCARVPTLVLSDAIALDARAGTFCAARRTGEVVCWGRAHGAQPTGVGPLP